MNRNGLAYSLQLPAIIRMKHFLVQSNWPHEVARAAAQIEDGGGLQEAMLNFEGDVAYTA